MQGSVFAIDRALIPQHRHIIVAEVDGELVLRRLLINPVPVLKELRRDENHPCSTKVRICLYEALWPMRCLHRRTNRMDIEAGKAPFRPIPGSAK